MINFLIKWCLENRFLMFLAILIFSWAGYYCFKNTPIDAIPDVGEKQVVVYADWLGRSPQDVEDQVTYRLSNALSGTPGVRTIRTMSGFGFSMLFVIFKDDIDYYWARTRILERLNTIQGSMPSGVTPMLGPDATALGQIYWYTVEGEGFDLEELRSAQDWYIRYQLQSAEGISEVASVGGYLKQYQIDINPEQLRATGITILDVLEAVSKSNRDVGAKAIELNGSELFVRGVGLVKSIEDLENISLKEKDGTPLLLKQVASVQLGPEFRRGTLDKNGQEIVGGVATMRFGENPSTVIKNLKEKIKIIEKGLPEKTLKNGKTSKMKIVPFYDRSEIIQETSNTLTEALIQEIILATLIVLFFLLHVRATFAVIPTLPLALAASFILMYFLGIESNIMALAGLAIAIGDVADMGIIMAENIYRRLSIASKEEIKNNYAKIIYEGATEVGGAITAAVMNTLISFLPVFFLTDQEGKMFRPLAFTKTFAIGASVLFSLTLVPFLCFILYRQPEISRKLKNFFIIASGILSAIIFYWVIQSNLELTNSYGILFSIAIGFVVAIIVHRMLNESFVPLEKNIVSRFIIKIYKPSLNWVLNHKKTFLTIPIILAFFGLSIWLGLHTTLVPIQWLANHFAHEPMSKELANEMNLAHHVGLKRPLLQLNHLRWQKLEDKEGKTHHRFLFRKQDPNEINEEYAHGLNVVSEYKILPGVGREFMPPLDEGSFLYMPSLLPQTSLTEVVMVNNKQDRAMMTVPEVEMAVGKVGRTESALDPAPISMMETIIRLKPESQWRTLPVERFFKNWPRFLKAPLAYFLPEERKITKDEILHDLQKVTKIPGVLPTWLQPIQTRLVMLQTGLRAMIGVKIFGQDLREIEKIAVQMEAILKHVPGAVDVIADRVVGKAYLELQIDREAIARYVLTIDEVQKIIETAIGGTNLSDVIEGRARYAIRVRLARDFREDLQAIEKIEVPTKTGALIPLKQLVNIETVIGPQEIKGEDGLLVGYVTMNTRDRDEVSVVEDAEKKLQLALSSGELKLPAGYYWEWTGQFENQVRATKRMQILVPLTLAIMLVMLYFSFRRWWVSFVIFAGVIVSASGGFIMLEIWQVNLSVAVWVGFVALFGVADNDGVVMANYLEDVFEEKNFKDVQEIRDSVIEAGLKRIRPCLMTTFTTVFGLMPVFWIEGRGADVMRPMAIPSVGGMTVSMITLFIVPCLFCLIEETKWHYQQKHKNQIS